MREQQHYLKKDNLHKLYRLLGTIALLLVSASIFAQQLPFAKKEVKLMGCRFELTAVAQSEAQAWAAVEKGIAEISRIERLISSWDAHSQTSEVNRQAGIKPVKVDQELYQLILRSTKVSGLSQGAFDISFASMDRIWKFDGKEQSLPDSQTVRQAAAKINWQHILLNPDSSTVFLQEKGMKIGFGAIGKGYAANRAKVVMSEMAGVEGGIVNASGDLLAWGKSHRAEGWQVQIADPKNKQKALGWLSLNNMSIVTSGDYERFFLANGKRYAHIVNPKTGYPTTGIKSVTIICPDAELADALATSVFVLGAKEGLALINQLSHIECVIVTDDDQLLNSKNLQLNYYK